MTSAPNAWGGRQVVLTGAAGFLGRWTSEILVSQGASVHGIDIDWNRSSSRPPAGVVMISGDVRDTDFVRTVCRSTNADTVIHLAAQTLVGPAVADPAETFRHNIEGTWSVLEACRASPAIMRIAVASSDKVYGEAPGRPYREEMALHAMHPYDASKAAADILARTYAHTYRMPVAVTRCGNLYGGGDLNWSRIVPGTIRSVLRGERPVIRSDGSPVRDYLFVSDAAHGLLLLADAVGAREDVRGSAFNFSSGESHSASAVVRRILSLMGSELEPEILATARFEISDQRISSARARRELSWRPNTKLSEGLQKAIEWYQAHFEARP